MPLKSILEVNLNNLADFYNRIIPLKLVQRSNFSPPRSKVQSKADLDISP